MFRILQQSKSKSSNLPNAGNFLLRRIELYTHQIRQDLDVQIDKRLVNTFWDLFNIILMFRNRAMGLLLTELGGFIAGFDHAPAGTKRISNLLRSKKWSSELIDNQLFARAKERIEQMCRQGKRPLVLWDDSRVEKHESWVAEGLCSVLSSKGQRLTRVRPGFYTPPSSRICVPGFQWTGVFLSHLGGVPSVCQMTWWTTRGRYKEDPDNIIYRLLKKLHQHIGQALVHVLDRGYANEKMLRYMFKFEQAFIIRWKQNHLLIHDQQGCKKTHLLARSFKGKADKVVRDKAHQQDKRISIAWAPVAHPEYPDNQLFLIIVRNKHSSNSPMYLITSLTITTARQAWEVLFSYMHRWEAEQGFRFLKSEMGIESPRLWFWENRMKLMAIVTLVYDFLLAIWRNWKNWVPIFLSNWAHRTGKRYREASIPLYRLRMAIANCLLLCWAQNSG